MGNNSTLLKPRTRPHQFRTAPVYEQATANVDRQAGIIRNVQIVREGEAKGHGVHLDADFVSTITTLGNAHQNGVKARFNHPNMSAGALGTMIGRFRDFRTEGSAAYADLYLSDTAKTSPEGDLYTYVLDMAQQEADAFGNSIYFSDDGNLYVKNKDGEKRKVVFVAKGMYDYEVKVEEGDQIVPYDTNTYTEEAYIIPTFLHASDLVDDPAATEGLFSAQVNSHAFAVQASDFLDNHPEIWEFVEAHPDKLEPFFIKYRAYLERKALSTNKKPPMKKQTLFQRLLAAFRNNSRFDIAITATDGTALSVVTDADAPAIGDEVLVIRPGEDPAPAPDGNYTAAEGEPNAGDTLVVAEGRIADIIPAEQEADPHQQPTDTPPGEVSMSARDLFEQVTQLGTQVTTLQEENTRLQAENERLRKLPTARHTDVEPDEDFTKGNPKPEYSFNQAGKEAYEKGKRMARLKQPA